MIDACGQILYIRQIFTENQKPGLDILHRQNLVHEWYDLFWFRILTYLNNRQMQNANLSNNWFSYLSILWWMCEFLGSILNIVVNNLTYTKFVTFWYIIVRENQAEFRLTGWLDPFLSNHWVAKDAMKDDKGSTK